MKWNAEQLIQRSERMEAMGHAGSSLEGTVVSKEEAAVGLGFHSVEDMDKFYEGMKKITPSVTQALERWYGKPDRPVNGQIVWEVCSICVHKLLLDKEQEDASKTV